jgi:hypothetical protein
VSPDVVCIEAHDGEGHRIVFQRISDVHTGDPRDDLSDERVLSPLGLPRRRMVRAAMLRAQLIRRLPRIDAHRVTR